MQMPEEESFAVLVRIMTDYRMREMFKPSMAELGLCMYQLDTLVQEHIPELYVHFQSQAIHTNLYASSWFLTLFTTSLFLPIACRILDCFLSEGIEVDRTFLLPESNPCTAGDLPYLPCPAPAGPPLPAPPGHGGSAHLLPGRCPLIYPHRHNRRLPGNTFGSLRVCTVQCTPCCVTVHCMQVWSKIVCLLFHVFATLWFYKSQTIHKVRNLQVYF